MATSEIIQQNIQNRETIIDNVNGATPQLIHIKVGYVHQIKNVGSKPSHTIMWISEIFNPETADKYDEQLFKM